MPGNLPETPSKSAQNAKKINTKGGSASGTFQCGRPVNASENVKMPYKNAKPNDPMTPNTRHQSITNVDFDIFINYFHAVMQLHRALSAAHVMIPLSDVP